MRLRANKYGAKRTTVDGYTFDSAAEARRYGELRLLEKAGEIRDLELQPAFQMFAANMHMPAAFSTVVGSYRADFRYVTKDGVTVTEDIKGGKATQTPMYRLKKRIVEANYGITITEVT